MQHGAAIGRAAEQREVCGGVESSTSVTGAISIQSWSGAGQRKASDCSSLLRALFWISQWRVKKGATLQASAILFRAEPLLPRTEAWHCTEVLRVSLYACLSRVRHPPCLYFAGLPAGAACSSAGAAGVPAPPARWRTGSPVYLRDASCSLWVLTYTI